MAVKTTKATVAKTRPAKAAPVAANDQGELSLTALAKGILAREIRPRSADIRRLAEAVLAPATVGKKPKKDGKKKKAKAADAPKDAGKPAAKKDAKKLAKIPGSKSKK